MRFRPKTTPLAAGQRRRHSALGTDAVYRVLHVASDGATVEVEVAPGLEPGARVRMTEGAVRAMELVDDAQGGRRTIPLRSTSA
jgi:hypothetical protein